MMDEAEEVKVGPFSRRMGWMDIPICFLSFAHTILDGAAELACNITMIASGHANYLSDQREFKGIVENYDHTYSIGSGGPESQDRHWADPEAGNAS